MIWQKDFLKFSKPFKITGLKGKESDNFSDEVLKQYWNQVTEYEWDSSQGWFSVLQTNKTRGEKIP